MRVCCVYACKFQVVRGGSIANDHVLCVVDGVQLPNEKNARGEKKKTDQPFTSTLCRLNLNADPARSAMVWRRSAAWPHAMLISSHVTGTASSGSRPSRNPLIVPKRPSHSMQKRAWGSFDRDSMSSRWVSAATCVWIESRCSMKQCSFSRHAASSSQCRVSSASDLPLSPSSFCISCFSPWLSRSIADSVFSSAATSLSYASMSRVASATRPDVSLLASLHSAMYEI